MPKWLYLPRFHEEKHAKKDWINFYYAKRIRSDSANTKSERQGESLEIAAD